MSAETGMGIIVQFPGGLRPLSGGRYIDATSEPASVIILPVVRIERNPDQPQRKFGEMLLFVVAVRLFLHIEIDHREQQRRPDVAIAMRGLDRAIWTGKVGYFGHGGMDVTTRKMRICRRLVRLPLANR